MEDINGKAFSFLPLVMIGLAIYVALKTVFSDTITHKVYLIQPTPEVVTKKESFKQASSTENTSSSIHWASSTPAKRQPKVIRSLPTSKPTSANQSLLAFSPAEAQPENLVAHLLEQGQSVPQIAQQTGLQVKEIRKMKRRIKSDERKERKTVWLGKVKEKLYFWQ